jgi:hypothetical protein
MQALNHHAMLTHNNAVHLDIIIDEVTANKGTVKNGFSAMP